MFDILKGDKPSLADAREGHPKIPNSLWDMIARCWDEDPSKRMSVGEVLKLLKAEFKRNPILPNDPMIDGRPI